MSNIYSSYIQVRSSNHFNLSRINASYIHTIPYHTMHTYILHTYLLSIYAGVANSISAESADGERSAAVDLVTSHAIPPTYIYIYTEHQICMYVCMYVLLKCMYMVYTIRTLMHIFMDVSMRVLDVHACTYVCMFVCVCM